MSAFVDEATIYVKAGDGGNGAVAWRREKFVPRGGPAGGDGGNGGDIILLADEGMNSLIDYRYQPHINAEDGQGGQSKNMFGKAGDDKIVRVPVGTQAFDKETGVLVCDLTHEGQREILCKGGSGGFGNSRFTNASRQAPDFAKPGTPGELRTVRLSLKLMADVGLLGFPNAGKSTFLASVSAAKPKIASYPFTTLVPKLGVVRISDGEAFVLADIPGLIEGAAEGAGLGIRFLKHLERVRVLLHVLETPHDALDEEYTGESRLLKRYNALRGELERYDESLASLDEVVVLNKTDIAQDDDNNEIADFESALKAQGKTLHRMSAATSEGTLALSRVLYERSKAARLALKSANEKPAPESDVSAKKTYDPLKR